MSAGEPALHPVGSSSKRGIFLGISERLSEWETRVKRARTRRLCPPC